MTASPVDTHAGEAGKLFAQRRRLLENIWFDASSLERLERRLRVHLAVMSQPGGMFDFRQVPAGYDAALVHWSGALLAAPRDALPILLDGAQTDEPASRAAQDALILMPVSDEAARSCADAVRHPAVQVAFLRSCAASGAAVPDAFLNTALTGDDDIARAAALDAAARDPRREAGFFRRWFADNAGAAGHRARCAAIRGGLIRGDPEALRALGPALEGSDSAEQGFDVLRVMALTGAPDHQETLRLYARREPRWGVPLLGLHGAPALLETLVELMHRPECGEAAAAAWWRMTGEIVPHCSRLSLVGEADGGKRGEIPDAEWAAGRLAVERERLAAVPRLLFGSELGPRSLAVACRDWAGAASTDLLDQARLLVGPTLTAHPSQWIRLRRRRLEAAGLRDEPAIPASMNDADPWEHGHYA